MATLLDRVQQSLATTGTQPAGTTDQTARARQLLAAKSGKQVSGAASAPQSAVAESAAVDQTNQQMAALQPQGQVAAAQVGQQVQQLGAQEQGARADLALRQQQMQQSNSIRKQQLLADLGRDRSTLNLERDKAKLEQLAHTMRMSDKRYTDTLEMEGRRSRLDNELSFREALQKSIFGSNNQLLVNSLQNQNALNASDRDFQRAMAQIDVNAALQMASNEASDARQAAMISGVSGVASAGIAGYGSYKDKQTAAPATTSTATTTAAPTTQSASDSYWTYEK